METIGRVLVRINPSDYFIEGGIYRMPERRARSKGLVLADVNRVHPSAFYSEYDGTPAYGTYRGHDKIAAWKPTFHGEQRPQYVASTREQREIYTVADQKIDIKEGDTAYFSEQSFGEHTRFKVNTDGSEDHLIAYESILCRKRGDELMPLNSGILLTPVAPEGFEQIDLEGKPIYAKFLKGTKIITDFSKKPRYLVGKVDVVGHFVRGTEIDVHPGMKIVFKPSSNYTFDIDGKEYYYVRSFMVYGYLVNYSASGDPNEESFQPLGNWVSVIPVYKETKIILREPEVDYGVIGAAIHSSNEFLWEIRDKKILYNTKKTFYLEEWDVHLVRHEDIYATLE